MMVSSDLTSLIRAFRKGPVTLFSKSMKVSKCCCFPHSWPAAFINWDMKVKVFTSLLKMAVNSTMTHGCSATTAHSHIHSRIPAFGSCQWSVSLSVIEHTCAVAYTYMFDWPFCMSLKWHTSQLWGWLADSFYKKKTNLKSYPHCLCDRSTFMGPLS